MQEIAIYAGLIVAGFLVLGFILTRLYRRSTKERGFVRTGFGGQKVILNGGALVLPVLHEVMDVNLNTSKLTVVRSREQALITKDRLRVDIGAEFYVRVKPDADSVAAAAQTLGRRTLNPEELKELIEAKFVDALRSVASQLTMAEMHENRAGFAQNVQAAVSADLTTNGLELESVSLTSFDQTDLSYFNDNNAFDAEGRARVIEIVEDRRRATNEIEARNRVQIAEINREARQKELEIQRQNEFAELDQAREVANRRATQEAEIATQAAEQRQISEDARITADQAVAQREIQSRQQIETSQIEQDQAIALARQAQNVAVSEASRDESRARAEADAARAEAVTAEESVVTAQETARANRVKQIALVEASRLAEQDAIGVRVQAEAERDAATARAEAALIEAEGFSKSEALRAEATKARLAAEAEGAQQVNEAENVLSEAQIGLRRDLALYEALPAIIEAAGKPIEKIEGIRISELSGLGGVMGDGGSASGSMGLGDDITRAALRYQTASPLIQGLLKEIGLDGSSLAAMANSVRKSNDNAEAPTDIAVPHGDKLPVSGPAALPKLSGAEGRPEA